MFCQAEELKKNPNLVRATPLTQLSWWAEGGFPCLVSLCSAGDRGPAAVTSKILGAATKAGSGLVAWGCAYTRGNRELALFAGRFKASHSCSEAVTQITCLGDENKGLQAEMQTCRGRIPLPLACPCLPPSWSIVLQELPLHWLQVAGV